ncbi:iron ABC transporter substrate-binding protein [Erythrobacteraceae bacterium CFH 75059]|nr:iron ABC transporter substrate-binding protein [Erythrobacteraceae bacterium CFH 75059]
MPPSGTAQPPAIVSLNPCLDAIVVEVAAPAQVRALSRWSADPATSSLAPDAARRHVFVSGSAEEVLALRPRLVLASTYTDPATVDALRRLGIRVETFGIAGSIDENIAQVRRIAALAGQVPAGERLVARMHAALAAAAPPPGAPPLDTVLWQPGGIVPGRGTLIADLLRRTGHADGAAARGYSQGEALPLEAVVRDPPRLLLVAGREAGQRHPVLARVPGMRVAAFDPALLHCGGPTVIRAAARLGAERRRLPGARQ